MIAFSQYREPGCQGFRVAPHLLRIHTFKLERTGELHFGITPETLKEPHESKPWNPLIANAFYRAGIIERQGERHDEYHRKVRGKRQSGAALAGAGRIGCCDVLTDPGKQDSASPGPSRGL